MAWAGRHGFMPGPDSAELRAVITPFYVSLEARRQTQGGGVAVGSVLLEAARAVRDRERALSARFERAHGVTLRFYPARAAPRDSDVFDFCPGKCEQSDTLFSVRPVPPARGDANLAALRVPAGRAGAALVVALVCLLLTSPPGPQRWLVALAAAWCLVRAPLGPALPLTGLFSPAAFYRPVLGVLSASAGSLAVLGVVLLLAARVLWRRGLPRRWWSMAAAGLLVLAAPYLVRYLGRGIAPPAGGVGFALWISWEVAGPGARRGLVFTPRGPLRGPRGRGPVPRSPPAPSGEARR